MRWLGLIHHLEALRGKTATPPRRMEFCLQLPFRRVAILTLPWVSSLSVHPADFRLISPVHPTSRFREMHLSLYRYTHAHPVGSASLENPDTSPLTRCPGYPSGPFIHLPFSEWSEHLLCVGSYLVQWFLYHLGLDATQDSGQCPGLPGGSLDSRLSKKFFFLNSRKGAH